MNQTNFPGRLLARRQGALARREANLRGWTAALTAPSLAPNTSQDAIQKKVTRCESDIANLKKKIGVSAA
jgi:hypothetical protein